MRRPSVSARGESGHVRADALSRVTQRLMRQMRVPLRRAGLRMSEDMLDLI
jgi:hypothetical protein